MWEKTDEFSPGSAMIDWRYLDKDGLPPPYDASSGKYAEKIAASEAEPDELTGVQAEG